MFRSDFTEFEFCVLSKKKKRSGYFSAVGKGRLLRVRVKLNVEKFNDTPIQDLRMG